MTDKAEKELELATRSNKNIRLLTFADLRPVTAPGDPRGGGFLENAHLFQTICINILNWTRACFSAVIQNPDTWKIPIVLHGKPQNEYFCTKPQNIRLFWLGFRIIIAD